MLSLEKFVPCYINLEKMQIEIFDEKEGISSSFNVIELSKNIFRLADNSIFNCDLTFGTEIETIINADGIYEITKIIKKSTFITRRFFLNIGSRYKQCDYEILGQEITRVGGFWQVDFGGIATINLPMASELNLDDIMKIFDLALIEIVD